MGLFELLLAVCLVLAAGLFCWILVETDRRIREWLYYDELHRQSLGEISGADIIWSMKKKEDRPE
jgi:hypothetical protein